MLKIENWEVMGWEHVIRGMRNPKNSWTKSDSNMCGYSLQNVEIAPGVTSLEWRQCKPYIDIGENDHNLMMTLRNAGTDHRKFMRMITVYLDITAPLYWWKEFDTYKVGTVANSCSTMHKIHAKEFTIDDFSHEHLHDRPLEVLETIISELNYYRDLYINGGPDGRRDDPGPDPNSRYCMQCKPHDKEVWWQMIQLLPSSYNQKRTILLNYEVLANIYKSRRNHRLDEWHVLCDWIGSLPYSELIIGEKEEPTKT